MKIIITGGAGFIGSHTCLELLKRGHSIHVIDNLCNSKPEALNRVQFLAKRQLEFTECDIRDVVRLKEIFASFQPDAVIHFAGLKAVGESVTNPVSYYEVNVGGTVALLNAMDSIGCQKIVFSSSATVYGAPKYLPCDEKHPLQPINPYGRTKVIGEQLLKDWSVVIAGRQAVALRYFNPVGADASGLIGEDPNGVPNNLMPLVAQVAIGKRKFIQVYGKDYQTIDGTGVRDFIHVVDLANAHVLAVEKKRGLKNFEAINIGTGQGISVLELIREFERQSGKNIEVKFTHRRSGDASAVWANASLAKEKLNFIANLSLIDMCNDTWRWQSGNPNGFSD